MALLSIAGRDDVDTMQEFVQRHELGGLFPHLADPPGDLWARFEVPYQPAWVFIDDSGEVTRNIGALTEEELAARLQELAAS